MANERSRARLAPSWEVVHARDEKRMRNAIAEGRVPTKALLCDINSAAWNDMRMACTEIFTPRTYLGRPHHLHIRHNQKLYIRSPSLSHPQAPSCTTYAQQVSLTHPTLRAP